MLLKLFVAWMEMTYFIIFHIISRFRDQDERKFYLKILRGNPVPHCLMAQLGGGDLAELLCFLLLASNKICEN